MNVRILLVGTALAAIAAAGCGGDMASQLAGNEQLRGKVFETLATHRDLAMQAVDRMMASDSMRVVLVEHLLHNDEVAKQVIVRIGTSTDAMDLVMEVAARDSSMRSYVMGLVKGMKMASAK